METSSCLLSRFEKRRENVIREAYVIRKASLASHYEHWKVLQDKLKVGAVEKTPSCYWTSKLLVFFIKAIK